MFQEYTTFDIREFAFLLSNSRVIFLRFLVKKWCVIFGK